jgi:O-antigen/teichoic acid export membrane protein
MNATANVQRALWRNSISNYLRTILRMVLGLLMFRMLYRYLSAEDFGFWSLLWSVFGYGVLVDFGLGFAAQKQVAELSVKQDWDRLSQILSTIIYFFAGVAMLIIAGAFLGADFLLGWFKVSPENLTRYRTVLLIFFWRISLRVSPWCFSGNSEGAPENQHG